MENVNETVRIMNVLPVDCIKGAWSSEFDNLPLYELVAPGVLKPNCGIKKNNSDVLLFDVSNMDEGFMAQFSGNIRQLQVSQILGVTNKEVNEPFSKITAVMPLDGVYPSLGKTAVENLGHDYVQVVSTDEGMKVIPVLASKQIPDNMLLRVHPERLSDDLVNKISGDIIELCQKSNGLYDRVESMTQGMDLK